MAAGDIRAVMGRDTWQTVVFAWGSEIHGSESRFASLRVFVATVKPGECGAGGSAREIERRKHGV